MGRIDIALKDAAVEVLALEADPILRATAFRWKNGCYSAGSALHLRADQTVFQYDAVADGVLRRLRHYFYQLALVVKT